MNTKTKLSFGIAGAVALVVGTQTAFAQGRGGGVYYPAPGSTLEQARAAQAAVEANALNPEQQTAVNDINTSLAALNQAATAARNAVN